MSTHLKLCWALLEGLIQAPQPQDWFLSPDTCSSCPCLAPSTRKILHMRLFKTIVCPCITARSGCEMGNSVRVCRIFQEWSMYRYCWVWASKTLNQRLRRGYQQSAQGASGSPKLPTCRYFSCYTCDLLYLNRVWRSLSKETQAFIEGAQRADSTTEGSYACKENQTLWAELSKSSEGDRQ